MESSFDQQLPENRQHNRSRSPSHEGDQQHKRPRVGESDLRAMEAEQTSQASEHTHDTTESEFQDDTDIDAVHLPSLPAAWTVIGLETPNAASSTPGILLETTIPSHISLSLLNYSLRILPIAPVCDAIVKWFMVGVHPIYPVVDIQSFLGDYHKFLRQKFSTKVSHNPPFFCLLLAVLFAGASAVPAAGWRVHPLSIVGEVGKQDLIDALRTSCSDSLRACQHFRYPTINTLVASILVHHINGETGLSQRLFIGPAILLAQSIGLHQDPILRGPVGHSRDHRRRVWWHLVWMDTQASLASDLPTFCGGELLQNVQMPSIFKTNTRRTVSVMMLGAIGRFEKAKLLNRLMAKFRGLVPREEAFSDAEVAITEFRGKVDDLIAKIPAYDESTADDIPPEIMIPTRRPWTSDSEDNLADRFNVVKRWTNNMLQLLKMEIMTLLPKLALPPQGPAQDSDLTWQSVVPACDKLLRGYLDLFDVPLFAPYFWNLLRNHAIQNCVHVILLYLNQEGHTPADRRQMLSSVDYFFTQWEKLTLTSLPLDKALGFGDAAIMTGLMRKIIDLRQKLREPSDDSHLTDVDSAAATRNPSPSASITTGTADIFTLEINENPGMYTEFWRWVDNELEAIARSREG
ncbi:hypothetical protein N7532_004365 [Penicillium argentinense]|uniref:Xylanolytic transcriptional activator regulatory domain-containing protein n=1 Tax=Penicillium argentinense TaxID=1131581 RepID=A0A9W9FP29_9EURO|nr:uncharacterized protein N7532_004365 [Penicillium argentinense]KAJ5103836.1 hypothetical protein N7532_004365 [Penicillium argentinense]